MSSSNFDSSTIKDLSGNSRNGTITGATWDRQNGTISLEWNNSKNTIGLEVGLRTMSYYMVIDGDESFFDGLKINDSNLNKLARNVGYV